MSPKTANSLGLLSVPDTKGKSGYKGLWVGFDVILPFDDGDYIFRVDEEMVDSEVTCEVFVVGQTASVKKTRNQKYSGHYIDGVLVWEGNI